MSIPCSPFVVRAKPGNRLPISITGAIAGLLHIRRRPPRRAGKPLESLELFRTALIAGGAQQSRWRGAQVEPVLPSEPQTKRSERAALRCDVRVTRGNSPLAVGDGDATEAGMQILLIAACTLAVIWIIVLWGSRYFGPR
jgi:hypothetical protein